MCDETFRVGEEEYKGLLFRFGETFARLENPSKALINKLKDCKQKCQDNLNSEECYEQMASLHLDYAELGIACDSAALLLYERHIIEENW